jgi:hypothetical protein
MTFCHVPDWMNMCDQSVHRIVPNCSVMRSERMSHSHNSHPFCLSNFTVSLNCFYLGQAHVITPPPPPPPPPPTLSLSLSLSRLREKTMPSQLPNCVIWGEMAQQVTVTAKTWHLTRCNWNQVWLRCYMYELSWYYSRWTLAAHVCTAAGH